VVMIALPLSFLLLCIRIKLNLIKIILATWLCHVALLAAWLTASKYSDKTKWIYKYPFHSDIVME